MNLYGFAYNSPLNYVDDNGKFPLAIPLVVVGGGLVSGCSKTTSSTSFVGYKPQPVFERKFWKDGELIEEKLVSSCVIAIYIGHNSDVPQGNVKPMYADKGARESNDEEKRCSGSMTASCANLGNSALGETEPAPSTVPGAPERPTSNSGRVNELQIDEMVSKSIVAARVDAKKICKRVCCHCDRVSIVLHYYSDMSSLTVNEKNTERFIEIPCN